MKHSVYLITVCWNEEKILPYFISHYESMCDKIIVYDNESTDSSAAIVQSHPKCELRTYSTGNKLSDQAYLDIKNNAWKEFKSVADWIIIVDTDEFLNLEYHNFDALLDYCKKRSFSVIQPNGYDMVMDINTSFPAVESSSKDISLFTNFGIANKLYSKCCLFNTKLVSEINYTPGCHLCDYKGIGRIYKHPAIKLLHYRYRGLQALAERYVAYSQRLSDKNKEQNWGLHYNKKIKELEEEYLELIKRRKAVIIKQPKLLIELVQIIKVTFYKLGFFQKQRRKIAREMKAIKVGS